MTCFFAVYDAATGAILRTGFCTQSADLALQARAGEAVVACDRLYPGDRFRVELAAAPPRIVAR